MRKPPRPTFKQLAPGEYLVRIPAGYDGLTLPGDLLTLAAIEALVADPEPKPAKPNRGRVPTPEPSGEERRKLRVQHRLLVLNKLARSQRELDSLCFNEGLPTTRWVEQGQQERQRNKRRARERKAHKKPFRR